MDYTRVGVLDYETTRLRDGERPRTRFIGVATADGYYRFPDTKRLLRWLKQEKPLTLLHHSNYEILCLLCDGARVNILRSHSGRVIRSKLEGHTLLNSHAIFPVPLRAILGAFGKSKIGLERLAERNYSDCVDGRYCILELANEFERLTGVNPIAVGTIAGTGLKACERVAGKMPVDRRFQWVYRGGRVELFQIGECGMCSKWDINSSYPKSILEAPSKATLVEAWVDVRDFYCPFALTSWEKGLIFPNGTFKTWFYLENFERYIEPHVERLRMRILRKEVIDLSWLVELKPLFARMYELKATTKGAVRECAKFFLNAAYGRMALKGEHESVIISDRIAFGECVAFYPIRGSRFMSFKPSYRPQAANYSFGSWITDNGRARWYASAVTEQALYGDTDSLFTRSEDFNSGLGAGCGEWKREKVKERLVDRPHGFQQVMNPEWAGRSFAPLTVHGLKDYEWGGEIAYKGGEGHYKWTLKQFASGGKVEKVTRTRGMPAAKRIILANGKTEPLTIRV